MAEANSNLMRVNGPDGLVVNFPQGTDPQTVDRVMREAMARRNPQQNHLYEVQTPDGRMFEVEAPDQQSALDAINSGSSGGGSKLQQLRAKFPQYNDMSDRQLAEAVYRKYYSDMPFEEFASKAGLALPSQYGPQEVNISAKGNMRPGDRARTNVQGSFLNSATLGYGDEIIAGMMTPVEMAVNAFTGEGPTAPGEAYRQIRATQATERAATEEQRPYASTAASIGGALFPGGAGARWIMTAPSLLGRSVRSAGMGAGLGGIAGFGEGESLSERGSNAMIGASMGYLTGAVLPGAGNLAGRAYQGAKSLLRGTFAPVRSFNPEKFAAGKVAEAYGRDNLTTQRVAQRLQSNLAAKGDLVPADVAGKNTTSLLRAAANIPSNSRDMLTRSLATRQDKQLGRLQADIGKALGDPKDFHSTVESLTLARKQAAQPLFEEAFKLPTPYTMTLENVLNRPLMKTLVERAQVSAANRGERFQGIFMDRFGNARRVPDTEALHRIKMEIDDLIGRMKKREETGLGNVSIRDLTILKRDLLSSINNPKYKAALRQYAGDSAAMNAINDGYEQGLTMEPEAIRKTLSDLATSSPGDADLWRMGFARKIVEQLRDTGRAGTNRAEVLFSPKYLDRMRTAFGNTAKGREFMQNLNLERRMARTRQAVEGNSTTAAQLTEGLEGNDPLHNVDLLMKLSRGDAMGTVVNLLSRTRNMLTGMRPEVADQIIRQLTSRDPAVARRAQQLIERELAKLNRRKQTPQRVQAITNLGGLTAIPYFGPSPSTQQPQQYQ